MVKAADVLVRVPLTAAEVEAEGLGYDALARRATTEARRLAALAVAVNLDVPVDPIPLEVKVKATAERIGAKVGHCPTAWLHGHDDSGHNFGKELLCGREWCPSCGKDDSKAHDRRFARWLPKAQQLKSVGYFVIEWPLASRDKVRSKRNLEGAGKIAVKVLTGAYEVEQRRKAGEILRKGQVAEIKASYFSRGLRRWHYFGDVLEPFRQFNLTEVDPDEYEAAGFQPAMKSNSHVNCLVEGGQLSKPRLEYIKAQLRETFNEPRLIVHYSYTDEPGKIVHLLKYVTRATFKDYRWDEYLAGQLYGFRNMRSWGKWTDLPAWSLADLPAKAKAEVEALDIEAVNSLSQNTCYKCGKPIKWSKPLPMAGLEVIEGKRDLGAGYYELPDSPAGGHVPETVRLWATKRMTIMRRNWQYQAHYEAELTRLRADNERAAAAEVAAAEAYAAEVSKRYAQPFCPAKSQRSLPWGGEAVSPVSIEGGMSARVSCALVRAGLIDDLDSRAAIKVCLRCKLPRCAEDRPRVKHRKIARGGRH